jgi:hypothetical protein
MVFTLVMGSWVHTQQKEMNFCEFFELRVNEFFR